MEFSVVGDCSSVRIWFYSTAMEFSEAVDSAGCKEDEGRDPVACFNVILFYVKISVVK